MNNRRGQGKSFDASFFSGEIASSEEPLLAMTTVAGKMSYSYFLFVEGFWGIKNGQCGVDDRRTLPGAFPFQANGPRGNWLVRFDIDLPGGF